MQGRQTECGGDGLTSRSPGGKRSAQFRRAGGIDIRRSEKSTAPVVSGNGALDAYTKRSIRHRCHHRLKLLNHAGFDEDTGLIGCDRYVEHGGEHSAFQVSQSACPMSLFRLQTISV